MELARVYTIGAAKYADRNWEKGIQYGRIFAALMRHAWKWWNGEQCDPVDGQHHLSSVAWCAFALMEYEKTHPEKDDRPCHQHSLNTNTAQSATDSSPTTTYAAHSAEVNSGTSQTLTATS